MGAAENELVESAVAGRRLSNGKYRAPCPFCEAEGHTDRKTSLVVDADSGRWSCFRCGERGRLRTTLRQDTFSTPARHQPQARVVFEPPAGFHELGRGVGADAATFEAARRYLSSRAVTHAAVLALHIGACAEAEWSGRVIVPHLDTDGETWLGWVGRVWVKRPREGVLPYRYPPGMRRTLFNARVLEIETEEPALAFEGALDVAHYYDRAVAFFGSPTPTHIEEIKQRARRPVVIVLDGDMGDVQGGICKSEVLAMRLRFDGVRAGFVQLGPKQDPDEVPRAWLLEEARRSVR